MRQTRVTDDLHQAVLDRDYREYVEMLLDRLGWPMDLIGQWLRWQPICVAPIIEPDQLGKCLGRTTLDHIKDEPRLAKRAEDDPGHLVSLCVAHTEGGAKAGYQWNTAHRPDLRDYLRRVEQPQTPDAPLTSP